MRFVASLLIASALSMPLVAQTDWRTPAEVANYRTTPDYAATNAYIERVAAANPQQVHVEQFGRSGQNRPLELVVVSKDGIFDPAAIHRSGRVVLLVQNSIHAGEMDGKDACLALLRELAITHTLAPLLDHVVFVFIPIYNVDGHERRSPYTRINQNGPDEAGWRANATNLNLNRDYMKADAPETRAFLAMFERWLPDFFVDDHVTDGADFQYDVTFTLDQTPDVAPETARWNRTVVTPAVTDAVNHSGHLAFPSYITLADENDPSKGLGFNQNPPRFSTGLMILENRPGMLVELHMLKDYRTRVTGNYELLRGLLEVLNREAETLIALNRKADEGAAALGSHALGTASYPLALASDGTTSPVLFAGYQYQRELSEVSGNMWVHYNHTPWNVTLPMASGARVTSSVVPPAGYLIPQQWTAVLDVLRAHGVQIETLKADWTGATEIYHCDTPSWPSRPFEGRLPLLAGEGSRGSLGKCTLTTENATWPAGTAVVLLNQRLSKVALHWLEPMAPDSAVRWGFFNAIFEQKEYGEPYVLEKLARENMARDPALKAEFERKVASDAQFAGDVWARLSFFYERSPWFQQNRIGIYPVGRLSTTSSLPLEDLKR